MKNYLKIMVILLLAAGLSGCMNTSFKTKKEQVNNLNKQITNYGVGIIKRHNYMTFVLPSNTFFKQRCANFNERAPRVLNLILAVASYYDVSEIAVIGCAKFKSYYDLRDTIIYERARKVAQYLWKAGIDASFMYANSMNVSTLKNQDVFPEDFVLIKFS
jgi:hypothetical protein